MDEDIVGVPRAVFTNTISLDDRCVTGVVALSVTPMQYEFVDVGVTVMLFDVADKFNVTVTDSHPTTVNSVYSGNFYVNYGLTTPSITPTNPTIDNGQSVILTGSWSDGFSPYTVNEFASIALFPAFATIQL